MKLELAIPLNAVQVIVRSHAVIVLVIQVQRVSEVFEPAELRRDFAVLTVALDTCCCGEAKLFRVEQTGILLLRNVLGEDSGADRRQKVCEQEFVKPGGLITQIEPRWIAQNVEAVGQEKVGGVVGVIAGDSAGRFPHAHVGHRVIAVDRCQTRTPHGPVLVQQQSGTIDAPVIVQLLRLLQIPNPFVETMVLIAQKRRVEPGGGIGRIETLGQIEFVSGVAGVTGVPVGLAEVASQQGPLRLEGGGYKQVFAAAAGVPAADAAQTAAQPHRRATTGPVGLGRIAESRIDGNCLVEPVDGFAGPILGSEEEAFQREGLGVAWSEFEALIQGFERPTGAAETEFQLSHARPAETEVRRIGRRPPRQVQRTSQRIVSRCARLFVVGVGEQFG